MRQNAPRAERADAINHANGVAAAGARGGAPTERHCRCRVGDDREVRQRDGVRQLAHSLWLIKQACCVATTEEEGGRFGDLMRQMRNQSGLASGGRQELLQGARLPIIV